MDDRVNTTAGSLLREWRAMRRMSQLDLALEAGISQRHLSFVESGRSVPSRDMVLRLAESLDMPLRVRNRALMAAGHAPGFAERPAGDAALAPAMEAVALVLKGHEPNPAIAVDRRWNLLMGNGAIGPFLEGIEDPALLSPPINVLRLSLHPKGLAPRIVNLAEWRAHILERLRRLARATGDQEVADLEEELRAFPAPASSGRHPPYGEVAVPLKVRHGDTILSFITTITVFGTPLDVTVSEIAVESFFPADASTRAALAAMALARGGI
jgi:transcriptional regulator with XRE-family HTH domain